MTDPVMEQVEGDLLTVNQACKRLGCGRTRLFELLSTGQITSTLYRRRRLISNRSLNMYIHMTADDLRKQAGQT